jgi:para-aminobenzoate synthetase / 4-amino-4-deoxychorismate lyase
MVAPFENAGACLEQFNSAGKRMIRLAQARFMTSSFPRADTPFVLLDDARAAGAAPARLYVDPVEIVTTRRIDEVAAALEALRTATRGGLHAAGYLAYEAGHALEPTLTPLVAPVAEGPLLWFGLFRGFEEIAPGGVADMLPPAEGAWISGARPDIARADYDAAMARVQALITAGDIYQANLTFRATVRTAGHPLALYAGLRGRARAGYGGVIHTGRDWILSLSPELFFACDGDRVWTRPMKGTAARKVDPVEDQAAALEMQADPKQRAENLMIVDLLRNDLSRVAVPGSVAVPELFRVETYPTVHTMTSTVTATLPQGRDAVDIIRALYPCGSITGAPKIRAMEAIGEIEADPRGVYTGSIGRIDAGGVSAAFNVAIRTLYLDEGTARVGLGSGVVADSNAPDEWAECLAKGAFIGSQRAFDLIETMAFDPHHGIFRLEGHLARMKASAAALGFRFDRHAARNELQAATFHLREARRLRVLLARSGVMAIETRVMPDVPTGPVAVRVVPLPVDPTDIRLRHKTTDRRFYDAARAGAFEVLFVDPDGFLTEGSFTNIFVERDGKLLTPPLSLGLLGGVLRQELIDEGRAIETKLRVDDLNEGFFIGNSVRGLLPARLTAL